MAKRNRGDRRSLVETIVGLKPKDQSNNSSTNNKDVVDSISEVKETLEAPIKVDLDEIVLALTNMSKILENFTKSVATIQKETVKNVAEAVKTESPAEQVASVADAISEAVTNGITFGFSSVSGLLIQPPPLTITMGGDEAAKYASEERKGLDAAEANQENKGDGFMEGFKKAMDGITGVFLNLEHTLLLANKRFDKMEFGWNISTLVGGLAFAVGGFIAYVETIIVELTAIVKMFPKFTGWLGKIGSKLGSFFSGEGKVATMLGKFTGWLGKIATWFGEVGGAMKPVMSILGRLTGLSKLVGMFNGLVTIGKLSFGLGKLVGKLVAPLMMLWDSLSGIYTSFMANWSKMPTGAGWGEKLGVIGKALFHALDGVLKFGTVIVDFIGSIVSTAFEWIFGKDNVVSKFLDGNKLTEKVSGFTEGIIKYFEGIAYDFFSIILDPEARGKMFDVIGSTVMTKLFEVGRWITNFVEDIFGYISKAFNAVSGARDSLLESTGIKNIAEKFFDFIKECLRSILPDPSSGTGEWVSKVIPDEVYEFAGLPPNKKIKRGIELTNRFKNGEKLTEDEKLEMIQFNSAEALKKRQEIDKANSITPVPSQSGNTLTSAGNSLAAPVVTVNNIKQGDTVVSNTNNTSAGGESKLIVTPSFSAVAGSF